MTDLGLFPRGLLVGLAVAAPVGPIGVLCIRRTLAEGRAVGFVSGLGAATADATYGAVAALGLTGLSAALVGAQDAVRVVGGLFLLWLGVRTWRAVPTGRAAEATGSGLLGAWASTFALTLTNPATILSFVAVFAGLGLAAGSGPADAALLVLGVFLGSALWWLALSSAVSLARGALTPARLVWVNRVSGAILAAFGLVALLSLVGAP